MERSTQAQEILEEGASEPNLEDLSPARAGWPKEIGILI